MLTHCFSDPVMLNLIQHTAAAPHLEGLIAALIERRYSPVTIQRYVRAAAHLSYWQQRRARSLTDLDATNLGEFKQHLRTCQCKGVQRVNDYDLRDAQMLLRHLQQTAVISVTDRTRKVKKLKRQRTRSLIHGPDNGSADHPAHSWGDQWRRHSGTTVGARGPLWPGRASLPTLPGRWIKSCWRGTNIWPRKTAS
jgi:hypothetical protein